MKDAAGRFNITYVDGSEPEGYELVVLRLPKYEVIHEISAEDEDELRLEMEIVSKLMELSVLEEINPMLHMKLMQYLLDLSGKVVEMKMEKALNA